MTLNNKTILITGAAGFIGAALCEKIVEKYTNIHIIGIDNMNDYYDVELKEYRLNKLLKKFEQSGSSINFIRGDITDSNLVNNLFMENNINLVVNLAAQAGVRYSISNPASYIQSNIIGFYNILEGVRNSDVEHLIYASSSSVYGSNSEIPYSTNDKVDNPLSLYAATKKSNELFAHAYSKLYNIPSTGLRFFTVYGPAGRPDMAYFNFTNRLLNNETIDIFNYGKCMRDFTYIDDITEGIIKVMCSTPRKQIGIDGLPIPPYKIYNIGNSNPINLMDFIRVLKEELVNAKVLSKNFNLENYIKLVPMQPGDVAVTYADTTPLETDFGYKPDTDINVGLKKFAEWYYDYYLSKKERKKP